MGAALPHRYYLDKRWDELCGVQASKSSKKPDLERWAWKPQLNTLLSLPVANRAELQDPNGLSTPEA